MLKVGTPVRQVVKPVEGTVKRLVPVNDGTELEYLVEYTDQVTGEKIERHFKEEDLEVVK